MPGDSVIINQKPGTVFVSGEVYNPGLIEFESTKSLKITSTLPEALQSLETRVI